MRFQKRPLSAANTNTFIYTTAQKAWELCCLGRRHRIRPGQCPFRKVKIFESEKYEGRSILSQSSVSEKGTMVKLQNSSRMHRKAVYDDPGEAQSQNEAIPVQFAPDRIGRNS